jgi:hypothetical protein
VEDIISKTKEEFAKKNIYLIEHCNPDFEYINEISDDAINDRNIDNPEVTLCNTENYCQEDGLNVFIMGGFDNLETNGRPNRK